MPRLCQCRLKVVLLDKQRKMHYSTLMSMPEIDYTVYGPMASTVRIRMATEVPTVLDVAFPGVIGLGVDLLTSRSRNIGGQKR